MKMLLFTVLCVLAIVPGAHAGNRIYGVEGSSLENPGYRIFISDDILLTIDRSPSTTSCTAVAEETAKLLGDLRGLLQDKRLPLENTGHASYALACSTFHYVVSHLRDADDVRRLWLVFADSATGPSLARTYEAAGVNDETVTVGELKRLNDVSRYLAFFTREKGWKLTEYTFLSQAFKAGTGKNLSPAFAIFLADLLAGRKTEALDVVTSVDLENLALLLKAPPPAPNRALSAAVTGIAAGSAAPASLSVP